jgi:hypothetical protein
VDAEHGGALTDIERATGEAIVRRSTESACGDPSSSVCFRWNER